MGRQSREEKIKDSGRLDTVIRQRDIGREGVEEADGGRRGRG